MSHAASRRMTGRWAPLILLAVEAAILIAVWIAVRTESYRVRRRRRRCPLDGASTILYLGEWRTGEPSRVIRCSLREGQVTRNCHEECVRNSAEKGEPDERR
jgi:hypothetical protein